MCGTASRSTPLVQGLIANLRDSIFHAHPRMAFGKQISLNAQRDLYKAELQRHHTQSPGSDRTFKARRLV